MKNDESLEDLRSTVKRLEEENEQLREDVQNYVMLVDNKDKYAIQLEREWRKEQEISALYKAEAAHYKDQLSYYQNLRVVIWYLRLRHFAGRVKRKLKKMLGKQ